MNTMEVLTLLLVVFAALSYIDNHFDKKKQHPLPPKVQDAILCSLNFIEGKSDFVSDCFCLDYTLGRLRNQASFLLLSGCFLRLRISAKW